MPVAEKIQGCGSRPPGPPPARVGSLRWWSRQVRARPHPAAVELPQGTAAPPEPGHGQVHCTDSLVLQRRHVTNKERSRLCSTCRCRGPSGHFWSSGSLSAAHGPASRRRPVSVSQTRRQAHTRSVCPSRPAEPGPSQAVGGRSPCADHSAHGWPLRLALDRRAAREP